MESKIEASQNLVSVRPLLEAYPAHLVWKELIRERSCHTPLAYDAYPLIAEDGYDRIEIALELYGLDEGGQDGT